MAWTQAIQGGGGGGCCLCANFQWKKPVTLRFPLRKVTSTLALPKMTVKPLCDLLRMWVILTRWRVANCTWCMMNVHWMYGLYRQPSLRSLLQSASLWPNNRNDRRSITFTAVDSAYNLTADWADVYCIRHSWFNENNSTGGFNSQYMMIKNATNEPVNYENIEMIKAQIPWKRRGIFLFSKHIPTHKLYKCN